MTEHSYTLGIDIGSTTVKIALMDESGQILFSDYQRHFAEIQTTAAKLIREAYDRTGDVKVSPAITGSGGLTLAKNLGVPFVQEVVAVATAIKSFCPKTDVAIELGGEDAKIIYFENGNVEQRMNGICAGGTGSFIDQMADLLQTDASGLNEYARHYQAIYPIAARCGVFAKTDIQPLINEGATKEDLAASIFQAVCNQTISGLACGKPIRGPRELSPVRGGRRRDERSRGREIRGEDRGTRLCAGRTAGLSEGSDGPSGARRPHAVRGQPDGAAFPVAGGL